MISPNKAGENPKFKGGGGTLLLEITEDGKNEDSVDGSEIRRENHLECKKPW